MCHACLKIYFMQPHMHGLFLLLGITVTCGIAVHAIAERTRHWKGHPETGNQEHQEQCYNCSGQVLHGCCSLRLWVDMQVITERTLVEESGSFEEAVLSKDKAALADFCSAKASRAPPDEAESWAFMRLLFQDDSRGCVKAILLEASWSGIPQSATMSLRLCPCVRC